MFVFYEPKSFHFLQTRFQMIVGSESEANKIMIYIIVLVGSLSFHYRLRAFTVNFVSASS